jgi:L-ribulose-5-phosphate 3-epimerase
VGSKLIKNPLGVLQGRLLPKYKSRYQAHPVGYWQDEFYLAAELDLDCIEFILDYNDYQNNPIMTANGRKEIRSLSATTGVSVLSICADYFMEAPLHSANKQTALQSMNVLNDLIKAAEVLEIKDVVIPCVDKSSIQDELLCDRFKEVIFSFVQEIKQFEVNLSLETDLDPIKFGKLLTALDTPQVTVNYDIGNSAALGYDYADELNAYGERISDIHIKDRELFGDSVKLGSGNADIPGFFEYLDNFNYQGPFIMQSYRDDEGLKIFQDQLEWIRPYISS